MNQQIKSLADEIREKLRDQQPPVAESDDGQPMDINSGIQPEADPAHRDPLPPAADLNPSSQTPKKYTEAQVNRFFEQLEGFQYLGEQKSMIRVDAATMKLLRRLKLVRGVEMNKVIVFALHQLLSRHPWLRTYIQDSLKNPDL
ncbi:MAG: hypothetical protein EOO09_22580 [Chitinophagaceae bacterium]|nr:MAG: hypothetical protein EOO09_22580 [Chitinophagaceae bacterium]